MMKFGVLIIALCCFASCTPNYEKSIVKWAKANTSEDWNDFEILEVVEIHDVTVVDSIQLLKKKIAYLKEVEESRLSRLLLPAKRQNIRERIEAYEYLVNSVYIHRGESEVLAKLVKCKYSIHSPVINTRQEKVETFLLNPNMDRCQGIALLKDENE